MKICNKCNTENDDKFLYCGHCGNRLVEQVKPLFCPYCGKSVENNNDFCPYCGKSLNEKEVIFKKNYVEKRSAIEEDYVDFSIDGSVFKTNPVVKWISIVFLYFVGLITWLVMYHFPRIYRSEMVLGSMGFKTHNNALPLENTIFIVIVGYMLLVIIYFVIKNLNIKASKFFNYIVIYGVTCNLFGLLGGLFGGIVAILCLWVIQRTLNGEKKLGV